MADYEALRLVNQLCFPLYACSREIVKRYKPFLDPLGLTYTQYVVMLVLWERRQATAKELGELLHLDSGTLTPVLKRLDQRGLITRQRSREDERSLLAALTDAGEAMRDQAAEIPAKLGACIPLEPEEAAQLYRLLYQVLDGLT